MLHCAKNILYLRLVRFVQFPELSSLFLLTFPVSVLRSIFTTRVATRSEYSEEESIRFHFLEEQALRNRFPQPVRRPATETVSLAEGTPERKSLFLFSGHVCSPTASIARKRGAVTSTRTDVDASIDFSFEKKTLLLKQF